jgi:hypothetical protein
MFNPQLFDPVILSILSLTGVVLIAMLSWWEILHLYRYLFPAKKD